MTGDTAVMARAAAPDWIAGPWLRPGSADRVFGHITNSLANNMVAHGSDPVE